MERETKERKKIISVYLKAGQRAATSYYRFYQYYNKIGADFHYRLMISDKMSKWFYPIALQPMWKKVLIFFYIFQRVFSHLVIDIIRKPDSLVVSRCLINRYFPISFRFFLFLIKRRGTHIFYDFDDDVIYMGEVSMCGFDYLCSLSNNIITGSPLHENLINEKYRNKIVYMPTTDGDMHLLVNNEIRLERLREYERCIKCVWVGTFSALGDVMQIMDAFEELGRQYKGEKEIQLTIVCDRPLEYQSVYFNLRNVKWEREVAIKIMLESHIGIMPLLDIEENYGKCGFKLIQYLSVGLPVVGTGVGINKSIITKEVGFSIDKNYPDQWAQAINKIIIDKSRWSWYSDNAFKNWESHYDVDDNLHKWNCLLT